MIKNLNDVLSLFVLLVLFIFSIRILVWTFVRRDETEKDVNKFELFKDYINNTEE